MKIKTTHGIYYQYLYTFTWVFGFIILLFTANILLPKKISYLSLFHSPNNPSVINFRYFWSIAHYKFCRPITFKLAVSCIILLFCYPRINRRFLDTAKQVIAKIHNSLRISFQWFAVSISLLFFLLCWNFRSNRLIGDSLIIPGLFRDSFKQGRIFFSLDEVLPTVTNYIFSFFFTTTFNWSIETSIGFLSCVWGGLFIYLLIRIVKYLQEDEVYQLTAVCFFLSSGFIQIYFGDVENYALPYLILTLYIYTSFKYVSEDDYPSIIPILTWILSLFAHVLTFTFAPSLIYILQLKNRKQAVILTLSVFIVLVIIGLLGTLSISITRVSNISNMLSLSTVIQKIEIFIQAPFVIISNRLIGSLNEMILVSLPGVMIVGYFVIFHFSKIDFKDRIIRISFINFISCIICLLLMGPFFCDWNLFAFVAIGISMLAITLFFKIPLDKTCYYHFVVYLIISFFHTGILILSSHYNFT